MSILDKMLVLMGLVERRKTGRGPASGVEVLCGTGTAQKKVQIRDISPTGIFILTQEPFSPGANALLTLRRKKILSRHSSPRVKLPAKVVRQDGDGVALTFVADPGDTSLWLELMAMAATLTAPGDAVGCLRLTKALLFLVRVSAPIQEEIAQLMTSGLDSERRERLIDIVLEVEERLERWNRPVRTDLSPALIRLILQEVSVPRDELTQSFWEQLLATSCAAGSDDEESLRFAELLSKLLSVQLAIFSTACERMLDGERSAAAELYCSADEMRKIAHTRNLVAVEHYLIHMHDLGLMGETVKPMNGEQLERANMTPTPLGLQLYARCCETPSA